MICNSLGAKRCQEPLIHAVGADSVAWGRSALAAGPGSHKRFLTPFSTRPIRTLASVFRHVVAVFDEAYNIAALNDADQAEVVGSGDNWNQIV
jgi:hypothetical protein